MISVELLWDARSLADWKAMQNQAENDPDSNLTDLIPALGRLLGWLNEGEKCEQKDMRVVAMPVCVRPDFIQEKSPVQMSPTSIQNFQN
jgi:hypothetical protein